MLNRTRTQSVPIELGQDDVKEFLASFEVDPSDDIKCAAVGRLWEALLEKYPGVPFLMLRVADMRWKLNSRVTAYAMYLDVSLSPLSALAPSDLRATLNYSFSAS